MGIENTEKLELICGAAEGTYTTERVAWQLDVNERTVRNLKERYRERGKNALVHGNAGRRPANYIEESLRARIVDLRKSAAYSEYNIARFRDLLAEREGMDIAYTTLWGILKAAGIAPKAKAKARSKTRALKFKEALGERLGMTACSHDWFWDGTPRVLHGIADDATRRITGLYFCQNECANGYVEVLRQTVTNYGVPLELYAENAETLFDVTSWLGSIVDRLKTDIMDDAGAPLAKKRIEHMWKALQKRLPIWLKEQGIADTEQANLELHRFIAIFNGQFAREPQIPESYFIQLGDHDWDSIVRTARR